MNRHGFALLIVLLVVAALELLALSTIALATHESVALAANERALQATRAAESALRRLVRQWPVAAVDSLAISQATTISDSNAVITVRRLTWGQYQATVWAPNGRSSIRARMLIETLDVQRALAEADRMLVTRNPVAAPNARFLVDATSCALPAAIAKDTTLLAAPAYAFAGSSWNELASIADSGFVFVHGDTSLTAGSHTGVLIARGKLTIQNGADFTGLMVVTGDVRVEDGVHITGSIVQRGSGTMTVGAADLTYSPCAVARALLQTPSSRRLVRSERRFIPAF